VQPGGGPLRYLAILWGQEWPEDHYAARRLAETGADCSLQIVPCRLFLSLDTEGDAVVRSYHQWVLGSDVESVKNLKLGRSSLALYHVLPPQPRSWIVRGWSTPVT
jgi:hypothetical protein